MSERFATVDGLTRSVQQLAAGDPRATRVIYAIVLALIVVGVVLVLLAIWMIRRTKADPELLGPLERMSDSKWRKSDSDARRALLDEVRPAGAAPPAWPPSDAGEGRAELPPPVVEVPIVDEPPVEAPVVEEPVDEPVVEVPIVEEPVVEPVGEDAAVEDAVDEPDVEAPVVEADAAIVEGSDEPAPGIPSLHDPHVGPDVEPEPVANEEPDIARAVTILPVDIDTPAAAPTVDVGPQVAASDRPAPEQ